MPYIGASSDNAVRRRFTFLASASATSISGADANGQVLAFQDGAFVDVYLNGVKLKTGEDYDTATANTINNLSALNLNDEVEIIVYELFNVADTVSKSDGGTFNSGITVTGNVESTNDFKVKTDGSAIGFGADNEIELTHIHDTGLRLTDSGGTPTLQLHDANESVASDGSKVIITSGGTAFSLPTSDGSSGQFIKTNGSGVLSFDTVSSAADDITVGDSAVTISTTSGNITIDATANDSDVIIKGTDSTADITMATFDGSDAGTLILNHDLELGTDASVVKFGADNEITLTHAHNLGLNFKNTLSTDNTTLTFEFATGETDIDDGEVMVRMNFVAPDEASGSIANYNYAAIQTVADANFSSSVNSTRFQIHTIANTGAGQGAGDVITSSSLEVDGDGRVYCGYAARYYQLDNPNITSLPSYMQAAGNFIHSSKYGPEGINILNNLGPNSNTNDATYHAVRFFRQSADNGGNITEVGNIDVPNYSGNVAYNTTSDYRLKENIVNITDGITRVKQLLPRRFNWKVDSNLTQDGFIAHEAQAVVPESVTGTKDAVDSNGQVIAQGMDAGKLIPILTAALKEAITKIETLETKVATLESGG